MQISGLVTYFIVENSFILAPFQRNCRGNCGACNEAELKILNFDLLQAKFRMCL